MNKLIIMLAAALASACGGGDYGGSYEYDYVTDSGVRVRFSAGVTDHYQGMYSPEFVETAYRGVVSCMGMFSNGPLVVVVPDETIHGDNTGYAYFDDGVILISQYTAWDGGMTLRHEFVHYLLDVSGYPKDKNANHDSPFFGWCDTFDTPPPT